MHVQQTAGTNAKRRCFSIKGVNLRNDCSERMKTCRTLSEFKQILKNKILNRRRMNEQRDGLM